MARGVQGIVAAPGCSARAKAELTTCTRTSQSAVLAVGTTTDRRVTVGTWRHGCATTARFMYGDISFAT